jgi:hypothetical protein
MKKEIFLTKIQDFLQVWWSQIAYLVVSNGFVSILYFYFAHNHLNLGYIMLAEALGYTASVVFILFKKQFNSRRDIQIGFFLIIAGLLSLFLPWKSFFILIIYTILRVVGTIIFYVPYNILFFGSIEEGKKLHKMTVYWTIGSLVGILAPVTGGFLFVRLNLGIFVGIALGIISIALFFTFYLKKVVHKYRLKEILIHIKGTRIITMFDGALQTASQLLITLYLLTLVQDAFSFGRILSINALFSIMFSIKVAKFSDKNNRRIEFIWPLSVISALLMFSFYFVSTFWIIVALIIIFKFISTLFTPIRSNIVLDKSENTPVTWISRELYLNIGRATVLFFLSPILYYGFLKESFIVLGLIFTTLPFVILIKRIYAKN